MQALCSEDVGFLPIIAKHLPNDRPFLILDAGAHIGTETLLLATWAQFRGKILAVEAHPSTGEALRKNTDEIPHYVTRIQGVLTSSEIATSWPTLPLSGLQGQYGGWKVQDSAANGTNASLDVPTITLQRALVRAQLWCNVCSAICIIIPAACLMPAHAVASRVRHAGTEL